MAQSTLDFAPDAGTPATGVALYSGETAAGLNAAIASLTDTTLRVTSPRINLEQPIEIHRSGLTLDFGSAEVVTQASAWALRIERVADIRIVNGTFTGPGSGIVIHNSNSVVVKNVRFDALGGAGILVAGAKKNTLRGNTFTRTGQAAIILHTGTTETVARDNQIADSLGFSNVAAGIVVTDREVDLTRDPTALFGPDGYWVISQPITGRANPPRDNLIAWNTVTGGHSSGIYSDGGVRNVFAGNRVERNAKEGLCLDNGSTANVVVDNTFRDNGSRWGQPDSVLALDEVLGGGRLPDGSAAAKVPGISVDNAAFNLVLGNNIAHNAGGGIKLVRTGYFNVLGVNLLVDNNDGANDRFHFFGIELGAAGGASSELDFTPSRGNLVFSNILRGNHYAGVFFAQGSDRNIAFHNSIFDASHWAFEAAQPMNNSVQNNLTDLPSRNTGGGGQ